MTLRVVITAASALVAGCASSPNRISAAYVSPTQFANLTCQQIDTEITTVDGRARDLHRRLRGRADGDAVEMGIGLVLFWPALLFLSGGDGPEASEYAQIKGTRDALLLARGNCGQAEERQRVAAGSAIPGTMVLPGTNARMIPAATQSGYCIEATADYRGTGSRSRPAITSAMPRCALPAG